MEADWEVEIGGGAPVIDALWSGLVDLRSFPERIGEIAEVAAFPPLGTLLCALNAAETGFWTAKCDVWATGAGAAVGDLLSEHIPAVELACYIDVLPVETKVFLRWKDAETLCRQWVARLAAVPSDECSIELIVRAALAGETEGFGITAYLGTRGSDRYAAERKLASMMSLFVSVICRQKPPFSVSTGST